jgi:transposase
MSSKKFDVDFKKMVVALHENGAGVTELCKAYHIASTTLYKWIDLYGKSSQQELTKAEILDLKKEIARVREENDILKKAVSIFAKKSNQK